MATIRDVVAYLCAHYPDKRDLSKVRVTKMVYLADWRSAILRGHQITEIQWKYDHHGPYVIDVVRSIKNDPCLVATTTTTDTGRRHEMIEIVGQPTWDSVDGATAAILDHVISTSQNKTFSEFVRMVYSTYPIATQRKFDRLDLVRLAAEYSGAGSA